MVDLTITLDNTEAAIYEGHDKAAERMEKEVEKRIRKRLRERLFVANVRAENGRLLDIVGVRMR